MQFSKMVKIKQHFSGPVVEDIEATVSQQLTKVEISKTITPGMRIAITAGSRGIANISKIVSSVVKELIKYGAQPFIVPSMGSHGGATAEGQVEVLRSLDITEEKCRAPILSSMEVVQVGETSKGIPVFVDKYAWEADAIIIMGRVKAHTDFKANIESGLMKMTAVGMGNHQQALQIHKHGVSGLKNIMPEVAKVIFKKANILCGIAIIENALEQTAIIEAIPTENIHLRECELLKKSISFMPKLPVDELDILIVDEIGKNYSGTGMDTNIIGRIGIHGEDESNSPSIKYIIASDLSEESHGNALGIGLADLTTKRLFGKINFKKMNENVITTTFLKRASIPIVLDNDREALKVALHSLGINPVDARIIRIPNTLHLEQMYVSESIYREIATLNHIEVLTEIENLKWNEHGFFLK
ncbi:DUF2088 domain-containing protein [Peribacillus simplex]|uniref:lactate racemase domain-containing protein n=1 Tax=Peribacillus simplex TaxID=1478 RepID=UPI0010BEDE37|nr:lactate racemase domain-containing protein [Peribacillus simplex]TKH03445.1 DUF2088 domain-containing protein [Peribacillus simplex]